MQEIFSRHFETIKWSAEFIMLPLHWLAVAHYYSAATTLGTVVLLTYVAACHSACSTQWSWVQSVNLPTTTASQL